jgi:hypothetical protein
MAGERFEIYTRLMGGKDNLPPKLPTPPPSLHPTNGNDKQTSADVNGEEVSHDKIVDAFGNLETYDDFPRHRLQHMTTDTQGNLNSQVPRSVKQVRLTRQISLWTHTKTSRLRLA